MVDLPFQERQDSIAEIMDLPEDIYIFRNKYPFDSCQIPSNRFVYVLASFDQGAEMDELEKLEHLSLVSKICTELDNHLGLNDKDLGELESYIAPKTRVLTFHHNFSS